jgi:hypothetical protein
LNTSSKVPVITYGENGQRYQKILVGWVTPVLQHTRDSGHSASPEWNRNVDIVFNGCMEIRHCIDALNLSMKFISADEPPEGVPPEEYFRYHVNAYLQEWYILRERMIMYCTKIWRFYGKQSDATIVKDVMELLIKAVEDSLSDLVDVRGSHVHQLRYDDADLMRLDMASLVAAHDPKFEEDARSSYQEARSRYFL